MHVSQMDKLRTAHASTLTAVLAVLQLYNTSAGYTHAQTTVPRQQDKP